MFKNKFNFIICLLLGAVLALTQSPYDLWFLIFPVFSGFYYLFTKFETTKSVFWGAFLFGVGYFVAGLYWIGNGLLVAGNSFIWVWPIAIIFLPCLLSFFTAAFVSAAHLLSHKKSIFGLLTFCAALGLSEFVRGYAASGFPWNLYGYTWLGLFPITQISNIIGPYGLTLITIFWGAIFGYCYTQRIKSIPLVIIAIASFWFVYDYGNDRLAQAKIKNIEGVQVRIVQPNIKQEFKWDEDLLSKNFIRHVEASKSEQTDLKTIIIWPETAVGPSFIHSIDAKPYFQSILDENTILLAGGLSITDLEDPTTMKYHNSLFMFDGINEPKHIYDKSHLVPFGEYVPFQKYVPLAPVANFTTFERGVGATTIKIEGFPSFSPQICYEIIFPHRAVNKHQEKPDFIVTVTNDAWFGNSSQPHQHFSISRFRAIEQGIPVVRSSNTGISGLIDPYGRIVDKIPLFQGGNINVPIPKTLEKNTFYAKYGDIPFFFFSILLLGLGLIHRKII